MNTEPSEGGPRRVRRSKDKDQLIETLRARSGGAFSEIRDVLLFAAALGFERSRFEPITEPSGEPIRWETFINRWFAEDLVRMLAVAHSEDKDIASDERVDDQILVFEGFANGGLGVLQDRIAHLDHQEPLEGIVELIQKTSRPARGVDALIDLAVEPEF